MSGPAARLVRASAVANLALLAHTAVNLRLLRRPVPLDPSSADGWPRPAASVLIPARDEAARIAPCIRSVLAQRGADFELVILDDGSSDGTAEVVKAVAGGDRRVRLLRGRPRPAGWLGKPHACAQLADAAGGAVLVFLDADVELAPGGLAATLRLLETAGLGLVSPYPRQLAEGLAPRLVQPLLQWSWLSLLPLRLAERGPASMTAANGQVLAVHAAAYRDAGGHAGVRGAVIEDVALARAVKRAGYGAAVADGTDIAVCRMYRGWEELRAGYTKSLWAAFGSRAGAAATALLLAWLYLLPAAAALARLSGNRRAGGGAGIAGYAAAVGGRLLTARATGGRIADAWSHPASVTLLLALLADSWLQHDRGRLAWKGRPVTPGG